LTLVVVLIASRSVSVHWAKSKPDIEFEKKRLYGAFLLLKIHASHKQGVPNSALPPLSYVRPVPSQFNKPCNSPF
jgi:hypothetical protein